VSFNTKLIQGEVLFQRTKPKKKYSRDSIFFFCVETSEMEKKLYLACKDGKVEEVRKLLQNSQIKINWQNNDHDSLSTPQNTYWNTGATPFHIACYHGHIEIVKLLLNDKRVDFNKASDIGCTPFYIACDGHIEIVRLLLNDKRVDINKANKYGRTPFYFACCYGKTEIMKYMLESGREMDINKADNDGNTGLDKAKEKGNIDIVKLIESFERNPNETRTKLRKDLVICKFSIYLIKFL